ncbi:MAG: hypothetical protein LUD03_02085 [Firmicutes bacterium]|nr:hypothetical protein [Bacillota bacterium]
MPNFKKIISAVCAVSLLAVSAAVPVWADDEAELENTAEAVVETDTEAAAELDVEAETEADIEFSLFDDDSSSNIYYDFNDLSTGVIYSIAGEGSNYSVTEELPALTMLTGTRADNVTAGTEHGTNVSISSGGVDSSKCLTLNSYEFANGSRGPRVAFATPDGMTSYMMSAQIKLNSGAAVYYGNSTSTEPGMDDSTTIASYEDTSWHTYAVYIIDGSRVVTWDGSVVISDYSNSFPVIWGDQNNDKNTYTIFIGELTDNDMIGFYAGIVNIEKSNSLLDVASDSYQIIEDKTLTLPQSTSDYTIEWTSSDSSVISVEEGKTWTASLESAGTTTLTATLYLKSDPTVTASRTYTFEVLTVDDILEEVAGDLDIASDNDNVTKSGDSYKVTGDFSVITSDRYVSIAWSSSDASVVSVSGGTISVYPSSADAVTLTATLTYGDETKTVEYTLDLSDYYTEYYNAVHGAKSENNYFYYDGDTTGAVINAEAEDGA